MLLKRRKHLCSHIFRLSEGTLAMSTACPHSHRSSGRDVGPLAPYVDISAHVKLSAVVRCSVAHGPNCVVTLNLIDHSINEPNKGKIKNCVPCTIRLCDPFTRQTIELTKGFRLLSGSWYCCRQRALPC